MKTKTYILTLSTRFPKEQAARAVPLGHGVEMLRRISNGELFVFRQRGQDSLNTPVNTDTLARNDGLSQIDWWAWSPTCRASQGRTSPLRCSTRGTVITDPITPGSRTCSGSTEEGGDHGED